MIYRCSRCGCLFNSNSKNRQSYCKECRAAYNAEYRQTDKGKEAMRRYWQSEKGKEAMRRYRQTEKGKEANKRYDQSEKRKEVSRRGNHKRRAKKKNVEHEPWTPSEISRRDQGICHICGLPVYDYDYAPKALKPQYDHVWPLDKNGPDTPRNVKLSHAHCNAVKGNRWLSEVDRDACREHIAKVLEELSDELL